MVPLRAPPRARALLGLFLVALCVLPACSQGPEPPASSRVAPALLQDKIVAAALAASRGTSSCPYAALFFSLTLLGVKTKADFTDATRLAYRQALMRMAPGATIIPVAIAPSDTGQAVHTVALFTTTIKAGMVSAQQLAVKLRATGLDAAFDQRVFGRVHAEVVSDPYLADSTGDAVPSLPNSRPVGMITVAWQNKLPAQVTPQLRRSYVAALQATVPGSTVTYKTHIDDGDWTGAGGSPALQRLAMDTAISNASPAALAAALQRIRTRPGSVWPVAKFGQMESADGYGVRWVPEPAFTSPCDAATTIKFTGIVALKAQCDAATTKAYLAALKAVLPSTATTSLVRATPSASGCQIVTSTLLAGSQQASGVALATRLVTTPYPLAKGGAASGGQFGPSGANPALLVSGEVATGASSSVVTSSFILMQKGAAGGLPRAVPIPRGTFNKYIFRLAPASCAPGAPCKPLTITTPNPVLTNADLATLNLPPSTTYNTSVVGVAANGKKTQGLNLLPITTPSAQLKMASARATGPTTGTATATAPGGQYTKYIFTARPATCVAPPCPALTFTSRTLIAPLTGLSPGTKYNVTVAGVGKTGKRTVGTNTVQLTTPAGLRLTAAVPNGPTTANATAVVSPAGASMAKYVFTARQQG
ncbi:hypothetical protein D9Q98_010682, partial [Chlorella vulgaris]